jgi:putative hydrolase of the HAD superfamily
VIRTCLFDLGNVLVHFSHDRMCAQIGELCGRSGPDIRALLIDSGLQWDFERGRLSEDQFREQLEEIVGRRMRQADLIAAGSNIFTLNHPMIPMLSSLRAQGYRLVLLSNTSRTHFEFISRTYGVLEHFDRFVLSYQVGAIKPEPAIYEAALQAIGCEPHECFYTDDIPEYVDAGRRYGLHAEVFTDAGQCAEQLRSRGLTL